ncbi:MAG TPA: RNA methyltransferase [Mycobacteriales bacterium]|nr:RNA methyltransferase [Mycobacteriales bacterium]
MSTTPGGGAVITTPRHPRGVKARRLLKRAFRYDDRLFLVEGPQGVTEALAEPEALRELFVTEDAARRLPALLGRARAAGVPVHVTSGAVMDQLTQTVTPQGLVGVARFRDVALEAVGRGGPRLVAVLAQVRDPGNAGTVLRSADAAGVDAVVLTDSSVDAYNPKCTRASAGSIFHVPFVVGAPAADTVAALREAGMRVLAATAHAETTLDEADLAGPTAWVFGSEAHGVSDDVLSICDAAVKVPIYGRAESLNLATAAALCLYASARAQRGREGSQT